MVAIISWESCVNKENMSYVKCLVLLVAHGSFMYELGRVCFAILKCKIMHSNTLHLRLYCDHNKKISKISRPRIIVCLFQYPNWRKLLLHFNRGSKQFVQSKAKTEYKLYGPWSTWYTWCSQ